MIQPINQMNSQTRLPPRYQIHETLYRKYDDKMNFFCMKPIDQILCNHHQLLSVIQAKHAVHYSDDTEFIRQMYHYYTASGSVQINNRISLMADFYKTVRSIQSQYPLMILTKTKKIFLTRLRRLFKMKASDGSSDQSQIQNQEEEEQFQSSGFLRSMKSDSGSIEIQQIFGSIKDRDSLSEEIHNIYKSDKDCSLQPQSDIQIQYIDEEEGLSYLICDFDDIDAERVLEEYKKVEKLDQPCKNKICDQQYINNSSHHLIDNFPINKNRYLDLLRDFQLQTKDTYENPKHHAEYFLTQEYLPNLLATQTPHQPSRNYIKYDRNQTNNDNLLMLIKHNSKAQVSNQSQWGKQKIKNKAEQLLRRIGQNNDPNDQQLGQNA